MAGSRLASWARAGTLLLAWPPLFHRRLLASHSRDLSAAIICLGQLGPLGRARGKTAAHDGSRGWKIHSLLGFGANKSQRMQTVQRGFIALPRQGLGSRRDLAPNHLDWPLVPSPHGPSLVQEPGSFTCWLSPAAAASCRLGKPCSRSPCSGPCTWRCTSAAKKIKKK